MGVPNHVSRARIRPGRKDEVRAIAEVVTAAASWANEHGDHAWPVPFPPERVAEPVDRGELFVAEVDGELAGSVVLRWEDPAFWGDQPPIAGYLHMLAVRHDRPVRGLGRQLVRWAAGHVRERGRSLLRLDCLASNARIIRYYEDQGFRGIRVVPYPYSPEAFDVLLMEKPVG